MTQSILNNMNRPIKSVLILVQLLVLLFTMTVGPGSHAQTVTYIHTDGLGSPVAKSDVAGNLVANSRTRYEPYGMAVSGTATPTIGFTGHVNDADTGLTYMQQRYYDPVAGRFLSTDPVLTDNNTGASFNRYIYAENNPYRYIDPDGRESGSFYGTNPSYKMAAPCKGDAECARGGLIAMGSIFGAGYGIQGVQIAVQVINNVLEAVEGNSGVQRAGVVEKTNVSSDTIVCRGGGCSAEAFKAGGVQGADGKMSGISTGVGQTVAEATSKLPHSKVGHTTAGKITEAGGAVVKDKGNHANVSGLTPTKLAEIFKTVIKNPHK